MCEEHLSLCVSLSLRSVFIEQTGEHAVPFIRTSLHTVTGRGCFGWREFLNASWKLGLFVAANRISPGSLKRRHRTGAWNLCSSSSRQVPVEDKLLPRNKLCL